MYKTLMQDCNSLEGQYLSDEALDALKGYLSDYPKRRKTYEILMKASEQLIAATLQQLEKTDYQTIQVHRNICIRDMTEVLRLIARAILLGDDDGFYDFLLWMQNMMRAVHKEEQSARAYSIMQSIVQAKFPPEEGTLIRGYLNRVVEMLQSPT
ncbi:MAG: hypothetical protein SFW36_12275 [Leptolyngbyaceae cyanobacterium bins.59]|nr:hypothetical protein [Leptolyngbyaceae cyanobacterium bins.59]